MNLKAFIQHVLWKAGFVSVMQRLTGEAETDLLWRFLATAIAVKHIVMICGSKLVHCVSNHIPDADHVPDIAKASPLCILLCKKNTSPLYSQDA